MIGRKLGHYTIVERIGAGGMGEVYRAHDEQLDRDVALKVLPASHFGDDTARSRLLREARAAAALNHPHICTVHEVGEADGQAYIAMELVEGHPLAETIPRGGLPVEQVLRYGAQIAAALAHAHERGIVHRDLKSGNVVITSDGRAKVLDFGLAKRLSADELVEATTRSQESLTQPGAVMGTLPYMAPEQLRGQGADARSDVWALGVVLYEMAAGARPFQGQTGYELSSAILSRPPEPLPAKVPVELRAVIERCLAKEPAQRYQRAGEVRAALETLATGAALPALKWKYLARRRWFRATATVVAIALLIGVLVGLNVAGLRDRLVGPATPKIESIAVLPLENLSGDPDQDYLADGIHEALITDLARLSGLKRVIARTSVNRYKGTKKPMREIAQELNVDALVTGSVLRTGEQVRVTAQLINPVTEEHLWAERYERDVRDVMSMQNEIVSSIAREIELKLTPQEQVHLARARPVNPEAYDTYLKGRYYLYKYTPEATTKAGEYFKEAIAIDPGYAPAYAGLSHVYWLTIAETEESRKELGQKAREAVQKALELDDRLSEAHISLGWIYISDWNWPGAEKEFKRGIELDPNNAYGHHGYSRYLLAMGKTTEAIAADKRALRLDPLSPLIHLSVGYDLYFARRHDEAIDQFQETLEMFPETVDAYHGLSHAHLGKRDYDKAIAAQEQRVARLKADPGAVGFLAAVYAAAGEKDKALRILQQTKQEALGPWRTSLIYAWLGDKDRAFHWLEKAVEKHEVLFYIKGYPMMDPLRDDPRFEKLLRRMNFPEN